MTKIVDNKIKKNSNQTNYVTKSIENGFEIVKHKKKKKTNKQTKKIAFEQIIKYYKSENNLIKNNKKKIK